MALAQLRPDPLATAVEHLFVAGAGWVGDEAFERHHAEAVASNRESHDSAAGTCFLAWLLLDTDEMVKRCIGHVLAPFHLSQAWARDGRLDDDRVEGQCR